MVRKSTSTHRWVIRDRLQSRPLSDFDVADRYSTLAPAIVVQALFGLGCSAAAILARAVVDAFAESAGPFSLIYPAILIAALFGRWQAGLVAWTSSLAFAWYFVLPEQGSFAFAAPGDAARTAINAVSSLIIVGFAEIFRSAVRRAAKERDEEIKARGLLLKEIDHRMRNNFAIVESFLNLQMRATENDEARGALAAASGRLHSFAAAHRTLYENYKTHGEANLVEMRAYLGDLADHLLAALFVRDDVTLKLDVNGALLPREQAAAIGLVVNELITNAAKHAFNSEGGEIQVTFHEDGDGWRLVVADNGCGHDGAAARRGSGGALVEAFARQAGGDIVMESSAAGTRYTIACGPPA